MPKDSPTLCRRCGSAMPGGWESASCPRCLVHFSVETTDPALVFPSSDGRIELGDYELLEEIARGGMGVVYRARQRRLGRTVAVKVLAAGEFASDEARRRFRTEAEAVARLQHPGIVAIHDVGETDGLPWLSMDFIAGDDLAALVREQPLPARQAAEYARAIAEAVQHAHDHGVLHRDLKPSNVLLDPDSGPRITDFGIARCGDQGELTRTGQVLGSPAYTAPEQALGGTADARTDIYGLGALLYHLLTARPPFQGPTTDAILLQLREADPIAPRRLNPDVPRDLETICLRCLRKDPARRYATAREVAEDLGRFQRGEAIHAKPVSAFGKTWRWCRRRPAEAALLAALLAVTAFAFWHIENSRRSESAAKLKAEAASVQLRETNALLQDSLDRIELDRAEDLFRAGDSAEALAPLMRVVRRNPAHPVAAPRLASALWLGDFALPLPRPMIIGGKVVRIQFLRDGRTLLVCAGSGVTTWDAASGRKLLDFEQIDSSPTNMLLSPDEHTLAAWNTSEGESLHLFDTATGHRFVPPIIHPAFMPGLAFSPDSSRIVAATSEPAMQIRHARNWQPDGAALLLARGQWDAAYSPDGGTIATNSDKTVHLWDSRTRQVRLELPALAAEVRKLRFSPDGRWLAVVCSDDTMRFFSTDRGEPTGMQIRHDVEITTATFSADSSRVLTTSRDNTARVWAVPGGEPVTPPLRHRDGVYFAAFSADGASVVTCSSDHAARVWDARSGRALTQPLRHVEQPRAATFTPDGSTLYTGGADGIVQRWDLRHRPESPSTAKALAPELTGVRISPDGRLKIAFENAAAFAVLTDVKTGATIGAPLAHLDAITDASFSPDSSLVATASNANEARVWDTATGVAVSPPLRHSRTVSVVAFSPDSRRVATASLDGTARVWDARTGVSLARRLTHDDNITDVQFSPDGRRIATASRDKTVRIWDAASGQPLTEPLRHEAAVSQVRFEPDGERITTVAASGVRVWEVPDFSTPAPEWLARITEAISLAELTSNPLEAYALVVRYEKTRAEALATPGNDAYTRLARRLFQKAE